MPTNPESPAIGLDGRENSIVGIPVIGFDGCKNSNDIQNRTLQMLARALNTGRMVGFIGSGISAAYGYPRWEDLVVMLVEHTKDKADLGASRKQILDGFIDEQKIKLEYHDQGIRNLEGVILNVVDEMPDKNERAEKIHRVLSEYVSPVDRSDRLLLLLNLCDEALQREGVTSLKNQIKKIFKKDRPAAKKDPLKAIIESLRIRRFLTTNYDHEIENYLGDARTMGIGSQEGIEDLMKFAMAAPGYTSGVFHCHGDFENPENMVVTERDYQQVYLHSAPSNKSYRDALNLTFACNPILFMGVGMGEPDLLRSLRQFVSERGDESREAPLFALLRGKHADKERIEFRKYLYARFGVKVYYYFDNDDDRTDEFIGAVETLADDCHQWWLKWQNKPVMRRPVFAIVDDGKKMLHHMTAPAESVINTLTARREKVEEEIEEPGANKTVLVLGRPGTGKGTLGVELVQKADNDTYEKSFFATMHFANDFLSVIDASADFFLDRGGFKDHEPIERFKEILKDTAKKDGDDSSGKRFLLVIGGLERLLVEADPNKGSWLKSQGGEYRHPVRIGRPVNSEIKRFLQACNKNVGRTDIVLTSSVQPTGVGNVKHVRLSGLPISDNLFEQIFKNDIETRENDTDIDKNELMSILCHTLRGHAYALSVVHETIEGIEYYDDRILWLKRLVSRLTAVDLSRRAELTIRFAIAQLLSTVSEKEREDLKTVLELIALFTTPVEVESLRPCIPGDCDLEGAITKLSARRLLLKIEDAEDPKSQGDRYTAHTVVRCHVLHRLGHLQDTSGEPHRFELGCFGSEVDEAQTGVTAVYEKVTDGIDKLLDELEKQSGSASRELVRAAYGLIRSHWPATSIGRLDSLPEPNEVPKHQPSDYDAYFKRLSRFLNVLRHGEMWFDAAITPNFVTDGGMLYADELAWLYNQLGLVMYCQGHMPDAYVFFRLGQDVNIAAERGNHGHRWIQSEINLALVQIDRAKLKLARFHLDNAIRASKKLNDKGLMAQAIGFFGLLCHLNGDFDRADKCYRKAIKRMRKLQNRRGQSIFHRHRADLLRMCDRPKRARNEIRLSIASAESGRHPDLLHYARIAHANLDLHGHDHVRALEDARQFARRVGIPKLEADALKIQGHIALHHGETEIANRLATKCLGLAAANDMQLRLTAALVFIGRVARVRGDREVADSILRTAIEMGEAQSYMLQVEHAERERMEMGYESKNSARTR